MPFSYYRSITIDYTKVSATETNFPFLFSITDNDFKSVGNGGKVQNSSGYDICVFSDSLLSTSLKWEIEYYDPVTGVVIFWIKIPSISSVSDTVIYVAYGDSSIATFQSTASDVWDSNYMGVWHVPNGTTLTSEDSTSNNRDATAVNSPTAQIGKIDGGAGLASASTQYFTAGNTINPAAMTYSGWFKATSFPSAYNALICRNSATVFSVSYVKSNGKLAWVVSTVSGAGASYYDGTGSNTLSTGVWYYLTFVYSNPIALVGYVNGSFDNAAAAEGAAETDAVSLRFGSDPAAASREFNGTIDEIRISDIARSENWIFTEYNNQNSPETFFSLGSEIPISDDEEGYSMDMRMRLHYYYE